MSFQTASAYVSSTYGLSSYSAVSFSGVPAPSPAVSGISVHAGVSVADFPVASRAHSQPEFGASLVTDVPPPFMPVYSKSGMASLTGVAPIKDVVPGFPNRPSSYKTVSTTENPSVLMRFRITAKKFFVW